MVRRLGCRSVIGYLGPVGTFTHQALLELIDSTDVTDGGDEASLVPYATVAAALDAVRSREVGAVLVPIENSVEGGVSATLDNLAMSDVQPLQIIAEMILPVSFELAVRPGTTLEEISTVITHPHAAAQCRDWLLAHLPHAEVVERGSTAAAAAEVAKDDSPFDAAICASVATKLYGLTAVARHVEDNQFAQTRFVLVSCPRAPQPATGADKTTLVVFLTVDRSGALLEVLQQFTVRGVNLCRIESRPTKTSLGHYSFSIDAEGHLSDARISEAMAGLHRVCRKVVWLGSYPRADRVRHCVPQGQTNDDYQEAATWLAALTRTYPHHDGVVD